MQKFKQWQVVRIIKTGELATVYFVHDNGSISVFSQSGVCVILNADSIAPVDNTQAESEARSERAFHSAISIAFGVQSMFVLFAYFWGEKCQLKGEFSGILLLLLFCALYFFFKNTRKPEPPLS